MSVRTPSEKVGEEPDGRSRQRSQGDGPQGEYHETVKKDYMLKAKKIPHQWRTTRLRPKTGSAEIVMKKNGDITIKGNKISIKGSGDVVVKGSKIAENSTCNVCFVRFGQKRVWCLASARTACASDEVVGVTEAGARPLVEYPGNLEGPRRARSVVALDIPEATGTEPLPCAGCSWTSQDLTLPIILGIIRGYGSVCQSP